MVSKPLHIPVSAEHKHRPCLYNVLLVSWFSSTTQTILSPVVWIVPYKTSSVIPSITFQWCNFFLNKIFLRAGDSLICNGNSFDLIVWISVVSVIWHLCTKSFDNWRLSSILCFVGPMCNTGFIISRKLIKWLCSVCERFWF